MSIAAGLGLGAGAATAAAAALVMNAAVMARKNANGSEGFWKEAIGVTTCMSYTYEVAFVRFIIVWSTNLDEGVGGGGLQGGGGMRWQ